MFILDSTTNHSAETHGIFPTCVYLLTMVDNYGYTSHSVTSVDLSEYRRKCFKCCDACVELFDSHLCNWEWGGGYLAPLFTILRNIYLRSEKEVGFEIAQHFEKSSNFTGPHLRLLYQFIALTTKHLDLSSQKDALVFEAIASNWLCTRMLNSCMSSAVLRRLEKFGVMN